MSGHKFPDNLIAKACAACLNGCGTIARQLQYTCGVGDVEYFAGIKRTGPRAHDNEGVWTSKVPPCAYRLPDVPLVYAPEILDAADGDHDGARFLARLQGNGGLAAYFADVNGPGDSP